MCPKCDTITRESDGIRLETKFTEIPVPEIAENLKYRLENSGDPEFDTIVGVGYSGALVLPELAKLLGKDYLVLRKPNMANPFEVIFGGKRYGVGKLGEKWLFVDDFTSTGKTHDLAREMVSELSAEHDFHPQFMGSYYYTVDEYEPW